MRVCVGELELELITAARAAISLASVTAKVWDEAYDRARAAADRDALQMDERNRKLEVSMGLRTVIGSEADEEHVVYLGILSDVTVRPGTDEEHPEPKS